MTDLREGHRKRIKAKYLTNSESLVYDYEILELLLTYSIPRIDVKPMAKKLLNKFGNLDGVFAATPQQLMTIDGIGENSAILISLVSEIERRRGRGRNENRTKITSPEDAIAHFKNILGKEEVEELIMVSLDNSGRIIATHTLATGDINHLEPNMREIVETVITDKASRVIISHNHPHGNAEPSSEDLDFTVNLKNVLKTVSVQLNDHIVVGESAAISIRGIPGCADFFV